MESLRKDNKGQWIVLSGLVISLILVAIAVLANQAVINGYYSSNAVLELPKEDIRELTLQTRENTRMILDMSYELNQTNNKTVPVIFEDIFINCNDQMKALYAIRGQAIDTRMMQMQITNETNMSGKDIIWVNIEYNDGRTRYVSSPEVIEVEK
ncbi:hypothetical protein Mpsy_1533 [Methanolobus psychrophilus R15]|nr:hypothetical protein Mpsy_1533 [Methanolobus psychrophilus R15]